VLSDRSHEAALLTSGSALGGLVPSIPISSSSSSAASAETAHELFAATVHGTMMHGVAELQHSVTAMGSGQRSPLWALGIGLMVVGTIASSIGLLCFKRAGAVTGVAWYKNTWFWGGLILFVMTAAVLDTIVFAVTPLGLIAPFAGLTIVVSFALASLGCCGVKEPPTRTATAAVVLIVCGVTVCAVFGPKSDGSINPVALQQDFKSHPGLYVVCAAGGPLFLLFYGFSVLRPAETRKALRSWMGALVLALSAAFFGSVTQLQFKALAHAIVTIVGAMTSETDSGEVRSLYPSAGVCITQLLCAASTGVAQIGFLNFAISGAPVAYTVPAYQSALLIFTLGLSGIVLNEYATEPALNVIVFWSSATVIILGMLLNAWGLARASKAKAANGLDEDSAPAATDPESAKRAPSQRGR